jgi:hypothetical protein
MSRLYRQESKELPLRGSILGYQAARAHGIAWAVCLLIVLGGCAILPGHWRPGSNQSWPTGKPVPDTAGSWKLTDLEAKDGRFLALTISGGGSRAANFGAAVMLELQQRACWNKWM